MKDMFETDGTERRIWEACNLIRAITANQDVTVSFSGGKDSIALKHLVQQAGARGHYEFVYANTLLEPPDVLKFTREHYPEVTMIRPQRSWFQQIPIRGLPTINRRWCCYTQKERPLHFYASGRWQVTGIRAQESRKRSKRSIIEKGKIWVTDRLAHPIFRLTEGDVWHIIESNDLPYPDIYEAEGFNRVGCVVCPNRRKGPHHRWRQRYPRHYAAFERFAKQLWDLKGHDSTQFATFEEMLSWWYNGTDWKRRKNPKQMRMFQTHS